MAWHDVKHSCLPEKMLWLAVLRRSIFDFVLYKGVEERRIEWSSARKWLFGDHLRDGGLSFPEVCCMFEWDPEYVRRMVKGLCRSDIRRLESSKYREELLFDSLSTIYRRVLRWSDGTSTPFLSNRQISPIFRGSVSRVLKVGRGLISAPAPIVSWEVAI